MYRTKKQEENVRSVSNKETRRRKFQVCGQRDNLDIVDVYKKRLSILILLEGDDPQHWMCIIWYLLDCYQEHSATLCMWDRYAYAVVISAVTSTTSARAAYMSNPLGLKSFYVWAIMTQWLPSLHEDTDSFLVMAKLGFILIQTLLPCLNTTNV